LPLQTFKLSALVHDSAGYNCLKKLKNTDLTIFISTINRTPDTCKMCLFYILAIFFLVLTGFAAKDEQYLSITAVTTDSNDHAYLECWRFLTAFSAYPTVGNSLAIANTTNVTYVILPPQSAEGIHKPPHPM
jgi:hypothetical protein